MDEVHGYGAIGVCGVRRCWRKRGHVRKLVEVKWCAALHLSFLRLTGQGKNLILILDLSPSWQQKRHNKPLCCLCVTTTRYKGRSIYVLRCACLAAGHLATSSEKV